MLRSSQSVCLLLIRWLSADGKIFVACRKEEGGQRAFKGEVQGVRGIVLLGCLANQLLWICVRGRGVERERARWRCDDPEGLLTCGCARYVSASEY